MGVASSCSRQAIKVALAESMNEQRADHGETHTARSPLHRHEWQQLGATVYPLGTGHTHRYESGVAVLFLLLLVPICPVKEDMSLKHTHISARCSWHTTLVSRTDCGSKRSNSRALFDVQLSRILRQIDTDTHREKEARANGRERDEWPLIEW